MMTDTSRKRRRKSKWDEAAPVPAAASAAVQTTAVGRSTPQTISTMERSSNAATTFQPAPTEQKFTHEFPINDVPNRFVLTKNQTHSDICQATGTTVKCMGRFKAPNTVLPPNERPLFLLMTSASQQSLNNAVKMVQDMIDAAQQKDRPLQVGFVPQQARPMQFKFREPQIEAKVYVDFPHVPGMEIIELLRGPNGSYLEHISQSNSVRVSLAGGGIPGPSHQEQLHVQIVGTRHESIEEAKKLAKNLVDTVRTKFSQPPNVPMYQAHRQPPPPSQPPPPNMVSRRLDGESGKTKPDYRSRQSQPASPNRPMHAQAGGHYDYRPPGSQAPDHRATGPYGNPKRDQTGRAPLPTGQRDPGSVGPVQPHPPRRGDFQPGSGQRPPPPRRQDWNNRGDRGPYQQFPDQTMRNRPSSDVRPAIPDNLQNYQREKAEFPGRRHDTQYNRQWEHQHGPRYDTTQGYRRNEERNYQPHQPQDQDRFPNRRPDYDDARSSPEARHDNPPHGHQPRRRFTEKPPAKAVHMIDQDASVPQSVHLNPSPDVVRKPREEVALPIDSRQQPVHKPDVSDLKEIKADTEPAKVPVVQVKEVKPEKPPSPVFVSKKQPDVKSDSVKSSRVLVQKGANLKLVSYGDSDDDSSSSSDSDGDAVMTIVTAPSSAPVVKSRQPIVSKPVLRPKPSITPRQQQRPKSALKQPKPAVRQPVAPVKQPKPALKPPRSALKQPKSVLKPSRPALKQTRPQHLSLSQNASHVRERRRFTEQSPHDVASPFWQGHNAAARSPIGGQQQQQQQPPPSPSQPSNRPFWASSQQNTSVLLGSPSSGSRRHGSAPYWQISPSVRSHQRNQSGSSSGGMRPTRASTYKPASSGKSNDILRSLGI